MFRFAVLAALLTIASAFKQFSRIPTFQNFDFSGHPKSQSNYAGIYRQRCNEYTKLTTLDHFSWQGGGFDRFKQRYFVCTEFWNNSTEPLGPIFLYVGNEANVEKYIESTGIMWELAPEFGALLVFIEHRYYGKSKPFGNDFWDHLEYLSVEQALADYVEFLYDFQKLLGGHNLPVIGFGGSYGGMLGAWMRMKYPHALHGMIASSAPIWSFEGEVPPVNPNYFAQIRTYAASEEAGCAANCIPNIRRTWDTIYQVAVSGQRGSGVSKLKEALRLCPDVVIQNMRDIWSVINWVEHTITIMAESSYSFPSDYLTEGVAKLPAYPLRLACSHLSEELYGVELLEAVGKFVEIYYNVTKDKECFPLERVLSADDEENHKLWSHQYCTEMFQVFGTDGVYDMFWDDPWEPELTAAYCLIQHGLDARIEWATQQWGGKDISAATNIIFSNGEYDPWRGGGVDYNVSDTVISLIIKEGGHHADLMFSNELDIESLKLVRAYEKESIARWIEEVRDRNARVAAMMESESEAQPSSMAHQQDIDDLFEEDTDNQVQRVINSNGGLPTSFLNLDLSTPIDHLTPVQ